MSKRKQKPEDDIDNYLCPCCEMAVFVTTCSYCGYTEDESEQTKRIKDE